MTPLEILYRDAHYIAIDKPAGLAVHRTALFRDGPFVLQRLRDQIGQRLYPVHRLDRPTSGVLFFALSSEAARALCDRFEARQVQKRYLAVVRGHTDAAGVIDYALAEEKEGVRREAVSHYRRLATVELPIPVGRYPVARYSLVEVRPESGRMHQIRKHFKHIFHPLVGDTTYGEGRHNRLFREHFQLERLLLIARRLQFEHPFSGAPVEIEAPLGAEINDLFSRLGWSGAL